MAIVSSFIAWVLPVLASRNGMIGIGIVGMLITVGMWDHQRANRHRAEGATTVVQASQKKASTNAQKSRKAHADARRPGAADRLRKKYGR